MTEARLLGGRYQLGEILGYGGMAEVHRGNDQRLGRDVAVKVLRADLARDQGFQARFRREAQNAASLNHPSIVAVYDTGEETSADGVPLPFIVMEYVEGRTLKEVLADEGRLQPERAMEITADVCSALDFSHRNGIVHRDIKPANVMLTTTGAVKVMDFGIARAVAGGTSTMTQTSAVIGTAQYLSPEQARGETVDARSDVYSTGCLLYELLVGHPPFTGDSPVAVAYQHVRENPIPPGQLNPDVTPDVDAIVLKAMAKNPANRYQSGAEMRSDLLRAAAGRPVSATPVMSDDERTQLISARAAPAATPSPGRAGGGAPAPPWADHHRCGLRGDHRFRGRGAGHHLPAQRLDCRGAERGGTAEGAGRLDHEPGRLHQLRHTDRRGPRGPRRQRDEAEPGRQIPGEKGRELQPDHQHRPGPGHRSGLHGAAGDGPADVGNRQGCACGADRGQRLERHRRNDHLAGPQDRHDPGWRHHQRQGRRWPDPGAGRGGQRPRGRSQPAHPSRFQGERELQEHRRPVQGQHGRQPDAGRQLQRGQEHHSHSQLVVWRHQQVTPSPTTSSGTLVGGPGGGTTTNPTPPTTTTAGGTGTNTN
nr:Stk1 family PASTA domain-containing Ser/Thr kinase [Fodinicola feengrottensis]